MTTFYTEASRPPDTVAALYASPDLVVTSKWIYAGGCTYQVAELGKVFSTRGALHPAARATIVVTVIEAALVAPIMLMAGPAAAWAMAAVAVLVPSLVAVVSVHRWPPRQELWATYRGSRVALLKTRNGLVFGQVCRAVRRAIESRPRPLR